MKTLSTFISLLIYLNYSCISAEDNPYTSWGKQIGFSLEALSIAADNSGNCFVAGTTTDSLSSSYSGGKDAFLRKLDPSGNILWTINIGSSEDDYCYAIATDKNGNCILAGKTAGNLAVKNPGKDDAFVVKINSAGNIIWKKQFGTPMADEFLSITIDNQGNYILGGSTSGKFDSMSAIGTDAIIFKMNSSGRIIWKRQYGTPADEKAQFTALDKNNSVYIILSSGDLIIYNRQGNFISKTKCAISIPKGIIIDDSLNIYIGGTTGINKGSKALLVKYNKKWVKLWGTTFGSGPWTGINYMTKFEDGTEDVLVGVCQNYPECKGVCRRFDHDGNAKWIYTLQKAGVSSVCGHSVTIDGRGNCYLAGLTDGDLFNTKVKPQETFLSKISFSGQTQYENK